MKKIYHIDLSTTEQRELREIIVARTGTSKIVKRCYVLLAADRNGTKKWTDAEIASTYELTHRSVERIRIRCVEDGLQVAIYGKPREYKKERIFDGLVESQLVALRCSDPNEVVPGRAGWTLRLLSDQMVELGYVESISHESVRQILKKTKLNLGA
jgi:hypothetical protein